MRKRIGWVAILCVALVTTALVCVLSNRWRSRTEIVRREIDGDGAVIVEGDRASPFATQYRTAADLVACGRLSEAESLYNELAKKEPDSPDPYVGLASCRMKRHDLMGAVQLYQQALEMEPKSVNALVGLGSSYYRLSDYATAVEKYETALALDEASPEAHWGLVLAYAHLGKKAQARTHLDRFKQLVPDSRYIDRLEELVDGPISQPAIPPSRPWGVR